LHHTINRTFAFAALPSVIGGPGSDFTRRPFTLPAVTPVTEPIRRIAAAT